MASNSYKAKIPGSLMLFGEHAVLYGNLAIVTAIDSYITATLTPRTDNNINITSSLLGNCCFNISDFAINLEKLLEWQLVLTALATQYENISSGFDLIITSDFSDKIGFGSSAAVTVAVITVLNQWLNNNFSQLTLVKIAREVIQKVQSIGSGADVAASVFGNIISYQMNPLVIEPLLYKPPLVVVYSGNKIPTKEVIKKVAGLRDKHQVIIDNIFSIIGKITVNAIQAINTKNWQFLGELMNIHQGLQDAIGVNNTVLSELIFALRQEPTIYGAKISGSGLGDCVIGLGTLPTNHFPQNAYQQKIGIEQVNTD
jgi:mevalonate kinase